MDHQTVRQSFLDYMAKEGHTIVPPSPIIPADDPTLLFTNAGMNQFKDVLLGREKRSYVRAADVQPCMRVGGKHNDLDAVGRDGRHLTWFEMLGNWSFGDYYKAEAIRFAWELVTKGYGLPKERLYASVYKDDDESFDLWKKVAGLPDARIVRLGDIAKGDEENFWSMGPTGPCGPCTELYYDQGDAFGQDVVGGETDRYLEFWNLVFMEFDRDEQGNLNPLAMRSVDTGMGLERIVALMQGKGNVFETDLFTPFLAEVARRTGRDPRDPEQATSMRVIADHLRSLTFVLAEGGRFANEGRGYVLRRILRRAVRHAKLLGQDEPFLHQFVDLTVDGVGHYPVDAAHRQSIANKILQEEERFLATVDRGLRHYAKVRDKVKAEGQALIPGPEAFHLHDTFGFPVDLTRILAEEDDLDVDMVGFEREMEAQRERSRGSFYDEGGWNELRKGEEHGFLGHGALEAEVRVLRWRSRDDGHVDVVLDRTPFYPEGGGEQADHGTLSGEGQARVVDVQKTAAGIVHTIALPGGDVGDFVQGTLHAAVDRGRRHAKEAHHTATHLLHAALRERFGDAVRQAGSLVAPDRLRFDFAFDRGLTDPEVQALEDRVNAWILRDEAVAKQDQVPHAEAMKRGAIAFFGEKYGETVRVVDVPGVSVELCGGNHVASTARIGTFQIRSEQALAAGVRRIEAVCHLAGAHVYQQDRGLLNEITRSLNTNRDEVLGRLAQLVAETKDLRKKYEKLLREGSSGPDADALLAAAEEIAGVKTVLAVVEVLDPEQLRKVLDQLRGREPQGLFLIAAKTEDKGTINVACGKALVDAGKVDAGQLARALGKAFGAGGGGRKDFATAGVRDPSKLADFERIARECVTSFLS